MFKKNWIWNDPVWSKVIAAVIFAVITIIATTISAKVNDISFTEAWNKFWTLKVELWLLALVTVVLFLLFVLIKRKKMNFLNYTQGTWRNTKWQWAWKKDPQTKKYRIFNLNTLCPKCQKGLFTSPGFYSREYKCAQCGYTVPMQSFDKPYSDEILGEIYKHISEKFTSEMKYIDFEDDN